MKILDFEPSEIIISDAIFWEMNFKIMCIYSSNGMPVCIIKTVQI